MTVASKFNPSEPLLPKPSGKGKGIEVGDFKTFVFPVIKGREPSVVDLLAALVDEKARKRVERLRAGTFPKLMASDIVNTQPMTRPMTYRRQHR